MRILAAIAATAFAASAAGAVRMVDNGVALAVTTADTVVVDRGTLPARAIDPSGPDARGVTAGPARPRGIDPAISLVPEPAIWGLLIVGFSLVGIAARRRALRRAHIA